MLMHVRRRVLAAALAGGALAALGVTVASSHADATPPDLLKSTPKGTQAAPMKPGATYQASLFPIALRITPNSAWWGDQYRTTARGKPLFGWAQFARPGVKGAISLVTAYGPTPSVAATIARLQTGGSHAPATNSGGTEFRAASPVKIAGYSGQQFEGDVWGIYGRKWVPFTPNTHGASPADAWEMHEGEAFRIIALDVRGKTVVVFLESAELPAAQFPAFLASAARLLGSLRFPSP
jgi:hypothetical protein